MNTVRLSAGQFMYLKNTSFLSEACARTLEGARAVHDYYLLSLPHEMAEQFCDCFTDRLAKVGFDARYELTAEGKMLEELIDRFHLP